MSRSASPSSTRSASSSSSARSIETLYGSAHASLLAASFSFDSAALDALDDSLLFAPGAAFADACYATLDTGAAPRSPTVSRRSEWVQNFRWSEEDDASDTDSDEGVRQEYATRPSIDEIAPWMQPADEADRPLSVLQFRRPSGNSTFGVMHDLDTSALYPERAFPARDSFMDFIDLLDAASRGRAHKLQSPAPASRMSARSPPPSYRSHGSVSFAPAPVPPAAAAPAAPASTKRRFLGLGRRS